VEGKRSGSREGRRKWGNAEPLRHVHVRRARRKNISRHVIRKLLWLSQAVSAWRKKVR